MLNETMVNAGIKYYLQDDEGNFLTVFNTWISNNIDLRKFFSAEEAENYYISQFEFGEKRMSLIDGETQMPIKIYNDNIII